MNDQTIARRYAKAIYELAQEAEKSEQIGLELRLAAEAMSATRDFSASLESPMLTRDQKSTLTESFIAAGKFDDIVANSFRLLTQRNRLSLVPLIARYFSDMKDEHDGVTRATLASAVPLSQSQLESIQSNLSKGLGKQVILQTTVNPTLLGGVKLEVAGKTLDGTVKGRLRTLAKILRGN